MSSEIRLMHDIVQQAELEGATVGELMYRLVVRLYPICRSLTGEGVRQTLAVVNERIPLTVHEVPTGTQVFDWKVPKEWNIRDAYIKNLKGDRLVDFSHSNLHVLNYSLPVRGRFSLDELRQHLFTLPDTPEWIPYRTSYYQERWGFCLSHNQMRALQDPFYDVCIDSSLKDGTLTYGECFLQGASSEEVLISCHVCHPSLCNDNLSGIVLATFLASTVQTWDRRYSYRFLFLPGTIGAISWLAQNEESTARIKLGLVLACAGDAGKPHYKQSRRGNAEIDRIFAHVLRHSNAPYEIMEFSPWGYDERQFCSPGFDLPVGCFMRTPHGCFPEYHTSADDLNLVQPAYLEDSYNLCLSALRAAEWNRTYHSQNPKCEPQLGKRGLYGGAESRNGQPTNLELLWLLNLADGEHDLLAIAERAGIPISRAQNAARALIDHHLIHEA